MFLLKYVLSLFFLKNIIYSLKNRIKVPEFAVPLLKVWEYIMLLALGDRLIITITGPCQRQSAWFRSVGDYYGFAAKRSLVIKQVVIPVSILGPVHQLAGKEIIFIALTGAGGRLSL